MNSFNGVSHCVAMISSPAGSLLWLNISAHASQVLKLNARVFLRIPVEKRVRLSNAFFISDYIDVVVDARKW